MLGRAVQIAPAGKATWREMTFAAERTGAPRRAVSAAPFMPAPPPRRLGRFVRPVPSEKPATASPATTAPALVPVLADSFPALDDDNTRTPPDTMGAAGPAHLMTMLNSEVLIQDKNGNEQSRVSLSTFWTALSGLSGNPFDPKLVYDGLGGRWVAVVDADARLPTSQAWLALSDSSDPTDAWTFYSLPADEAFPEGTAYADFPGLGVNAKWLVVTNDIYAIPSGEYAGTKMWVVEKASALSGGPLGVTVFDPGFDFQRTEGEQVLSVSLKPAMSFDAEEETLYLLDNSGYFDDGGAFLLRLSEISGPAGTPSWSPSAGSIVLDDTRQSTGLFAVDIDFSYVQAGAAQAGEAETCRGGPGDGRPCDTLEDCEQPPSPTPPAFCPRIHTGDPRIGNVVFRNGRLWAAHSGGLPAVGEVDRTAVLWYEIDPTRLPAPIVQSGVIDPDVADGHHFYPSIAVNADGDACIGFSRSDNCRFAEAVATLRLATDEPGTMLAITRVKAGEAGYLKLLARNVLNRWGDYSATVVDPADDLTFWTIQEYAAFPSAGFDRWGTQWGKLVFLPPTAAPTRSNVPTPTSTLISVPAPCSGDCDGDETVTVDETIRLVEVALGRRPGCSLPLASPADLRSIVRAVSATLNGCPTAGCAAVK